MTTIAVSGVPIRLAMNLLVRKLSWIIKGHFVPLGFDQNKNGKIGYIKLSPKLNVNRVLNSINTTPIGKMQLNAYIPDTVPNFTGKLKKLPDRLRRIMHIPLEMEPQQCFEDVHLSIIREMEYKYTGLYELSSKTEHKLMKNICLIVRDRLRVIAQNAAFDNPFRFTQAYRKAHPHFGDFQLILSTLHAIEDAEGQPRSQIVENELILRQGGYPNADSTFEVVPGICRKYTDRIVKKVTDHIKSLNTEPSESPTEEEKARIAVRTQLNNLSQYIRFIIQDVIGNHMRPNKKPNIARVRVYGEPMLPSREIWEPLVRKHKAKSVFRSDKMFNLLSFKVNSANLAKVLDSDGTVLGDCKLIVRGPNVQVYTFTDSLKSQITLQAKAEENVPLEDTWEQW